MSRKHIFILLFLTIFADLFFFNTSFRLLPYRKVSLTTSPYLTSLSSKLPSYLPSLRNNLPILGEKSGNEIIQKSFSSQLNVCSLINQKLTNSLGDLPATGLLALFSSSLSYIISTKFHLSSILSLIITGLALGPFHLNLLHDTHTLEKLGEIGILFFIYEMGLEITQNKVAEIKKYYKIGLKQFFFTTLAFYLIFSRYYTLSPLVTFVISSCVSLSSSVVAINILNTKKDKKKLYGKISLIILLLQDIFIVPLLIFLEVLLKNVKPLISNSSQVFNEPPALDSLNSFILKLIVKTAGAIGLITVMNKKIFPSLFEVIFNVKEEELLNEIKNQNKQYDSVQTSISTTSGSTVSSDSLTFINSLEAINLGASEKDKDKKFSNEEHHREDTDLEKSIPREKIFVFLLTSVPLLSYFTKSLGLNETFGPFLSGLLINSSGFAHVIEKEIKIIKEIFLNFFFLYIGTSINLKFLYANFFTINKLLLLIILVKTLITTLAAYSTTKIGFKEAIHTGLLTSQSGEFALVVFALARNLGHLSEYNEQIFGSVVILSMAMTPLFDKVGQLLSNSIKITEKEKKD